MKGITAADKIEAWKVLYESSKKIQKVVTYKVLQNFHARSTWINYSNGKVAFS